MTTAPDTRLDVNRTPAEPDADAARGWYLYGITRRGLSDAVLAEAGADLASESDDAAPLQLIECSGLAAVVRAVPLADFTVDASEMEAMIRSHNRVIATIHARQAILPARFGIVYAHVRDIQSALRSGCDALLPQLHRLEGCDEWALHLYADRALVRERVSARDPALRSRREEFAAARPGRAYFLERQLRDDLDAAMREGLATLAQSAFDRLASAAVAGRATPVRPVADATGEVEILRAAFLVARDGTERFEEAVRSAADATEGVRCECSGPWPPYTFAVDRDAEAK